MSLVRDDWSRHAGFQRVRSTVSIFALAAYHWIQEHKAGRWAPDLVNVGDLPLGVVLEAILSSGLLHGNERAVQGFRQVASTDVVTRDGSGGRARDLDRLIAERGLDVGQPAPAQRMATALYCYSLVPRDQARRGATKAELLSAAYEPRVPFHAADEVFGLTTGDDDGLGALETPTIADGSVAARYRLSISQTPQMFYRQAKATIAPPERDAFLWERAKVLASPGPFDAVLTIDQGDHPGIPLGRLFGEVDQNSRTRLVVLDPRRWTLLNGRDTPTRADIESLLGVGVSPLPVDNAASCVVACVNTQRRDDARKRATDHLAWKSVASQLQGDPERHDEALAHAKTSADKLDREIRRAFQHYAFLIRGSERIEVDWRRFDDDESSSLQGNRVWAEMAVAGRAAGSTGVAGAYLGTLLDRISRDLTLKEVSQAFYKNPVFPLVRSTEDIRTAIFELTRAGWAVIGPDSAPLDIRTRADLSIGSMDQTLRRFVPEPIPEGRPDGHTNAGEATIPAWEGGGKASSEGRQYLRGTLRFLNQSVVGPDARQRASDLFWALYDALEPAGNGDVQLLDATVAVTAEKRTLEDLKAAAEKAGAQWREENIEF